MKKIGLISLTALVCLSLSACGTSKHKSSTTSHSSSKVVKHHKKKHSKKKVSNSSSSARPSQQQNGQQTQQSHSQPAQNGQQQTQSSNSKDDDAENLHLFYSDKANNGHGGLIAVYSHGDDPQTNQRAEQYGSSIAQNGGSGDYHYN